MRRCLVGIILALVLVFAAAGTTLAAPLEVGDSGFMVYGEYSNLFDFQIGVGYTFAEGMSAGVLVLTNGSDFVFGGFADLSLGAFNVQADLLSEGGTLIGIAKALYLLDLDPVQFGVGGGVFFAVGEGSAFLVEGAVSLPAGDNFSIYGSVDYVLAGPGALTCEIGVSLSF